MCWCPGCRQFQLKFEEIFAVGGGRNSVCGGGKWEGETSGLHSHVSELAHAEGRRGRSHWTRQVAFPESHIDFHQRTKAKCPSRCSRCAILVPACFIGTALVSQQLYSMHPKGSCVLELGCDRAPSLFPHPVLSHCSVCFMVDISFQCVHCRQTDSWS